MNAQAELDAANIHDLQLRADYLHCRALAAAHGKTYFLATRLLPPARRPAVHALYGFARRVDDIVDEPQPLAVSQQQDALLRIDSELSKAARSAEPTIRALSDTSDRYDLVPQLFRDFLTSMRMDLSVGSYDTFDDLRTYMHGSAAVIGLQMLPVLGTTGPADWAAPFAADLGIAFQLTNFLRDVGEDLTRRRIYLPQESLREFSVTPEDLQRRITTRPIRALLKHEIARNRQIYLLAHPGIALLEPTARRCVELAYHLYGEILTAIEESDYQVLRAPRVRVRPIRRIRLACDAIFSTSNRPSLTSAHCNNG